MILSTKKQVKNLLSRHCKIWLK